MTQRKRTETTNRPKQLELYHLASFELFRPRRAPRAYLPTRAGKVPHLTRPEMSGMIRVVRPIARGWSGLRTPRLLRRLERCFRLGMQRLGFALTHYNVQQDHLHLVVEGKDATPSPAASRRSRSASQSSSTRTGTGAARAASSPSVISP